MKRLMLLLVVLCGCNSDSSSDGGSDATTEPTVDLCDINAFTASGGAGHPCPHVSNRNCFPVCEASDPGGCKCVASDAGPIWECNNGSCPTGCMNETCDAGTDAADSGSDALADGAADSATE